MSDKMERRFAETPEELWDTERLLSMSGLEAMQSILDGDSAGPPIGKLMGFHLSEVSEGEVSFIGKPEFEVSNPMGTVHGGW